VAVKGKLRPLRDKILVHNMNFGEQTTTSGIVITSDNGKERGIYPRWAQVFAVGPEHKEEFTVGDWILIEHGRWTRGIDYEHEDGTKATLRMIDNNCVMMWDNEQPNQVFIGSESDLSTSSNIRPEDFLK
jgi:co-chaperonin GroES (HSP10)